MTSRGVIGQRKRSCLWFVLVILVYCDARAGTKSFTPNKYHSSVLKFAARNHVKTASPLRLLQVVECRGGASSVSDVKKKVKSSKKKRKKNSSSKKKKKKKEKPSVENSSSDEDANVINDAMKKNADAATALGDAIRDRGDVLLNDHKKSTKSPHLQDLEASFSSLGLAIGSSTQSHKRKKKTSGLDQEDLEEAEEDEYTTGGGVEASRGAILANYFLQSHGGAYAFQCLTSALSVVAGIACLLVPSPTPASNVGAAAVGAEAAASATQTLTEATTPTTPGSRLTTLRLVLLRRCLFAAMAKHASACLAAAFLAASALPKVGFIKTRTRMEGLAVDPVAQYAFYCALMLVWVPTLGKVLGSVTGGANTDAGATGVASVNWPWYLHQNRYLLCILGPILLREVVHVAWVVSDVAVIVGGSDSIPIRFATGMVDAFMSLISGAEKWRGAGAAKKQKILAKLVGRLSLVAEVLTGLILLYDSFRLLLSFTLSDKASRPSLTSVVLPRLICTRLYANFLLAKKRKLGQLAVEVRGGASEVPLRVLDVLLEPKRAVFGKDESRRNGTEKEEGEELSWVELTMEALGIH